MCSNHSPHPRAAKTAWYFLALLVSSLVLGLTGRAFGGDVEFAFSGRVVWVGVPFTAEIKIINASTFSDPVIPAVDGLTIRVVPGAKESSFTQITNGRATTRSTRTVTVEFTPQRPGLFRLPPMEINVDGEQYVSEPWAVVAEESKAGETLLVDVVGIGVPGEVVVGQPVELTLQIWIEAFRDDAARITLTESNMWSLIDLGQSTWGVFASTLQAFEQKRQRPPSQEVVRNDRTYYVYSIRAVEHPVRPGPIAPGVIRIVMRYPEGVRRERGIFNRGNLVLAGARPITRVAHVEAIIVLPLPTEGRPAHFTGAVGKFSVRASARPTEAAVGDPITLILEITDRSLQARADLANLRPPLLRELPALEDFRIPEDPTTGTVDAQSRTKIFTETLRPTSDSITEIPSIPFSSFDPELGRYVTVRTDPIPLTVSPSEHLDLESVLPGRTSTRGPANSGGLTAIEGGLHANLPVNQSMLRDERLSLDGFIIAATAIPPLGVAAVALWVRRKTMHAAEPHRLRASRARREAAKALDRPGDAPERVFAALSGLIAARAHLPSGTLTAAEATNVARQHGVPPDAATELEALLRTCEASQFAGSERSDADLIARAKPLLGTLDAIRPKTTGGGA